MESRVMEALEIVLPMIKEITGKDMQLSLCDTTSVINVWPGDTIQVPSVMPGVSLEWDDPTHRIMLEVIKTGKQDVSVLPREMFGISIRGIMTPVFEDGKVVGVVSCLYSKEQLKKVQESIDMIDTSLSQSRESVEEITHEAAGLADKLNSIQNVAEQVKEEVDKASGMVKAIQGNASRSNILALNASIEAARAGEAGRGFAVVANEMGKLAQVSGSSAKEISQSLLGIFEAFGKVREAVNDANEAANTQAATAEKITAALAAVADSVVEVAEFAKTED